MAIQDQQQSGQAQEIIDVLRRRKWQMLLPALFILSLGIAWAEFVPRKYEVRTMIELREMVLPVMGENMDPKIIHRDVRNAQMHLRAKNRIQGVVEKLQWNDYLAVANDRQLRSEYVKRVTENIKITTTGGGKDNPTTFLIINFADTNPERAEQFLNTLRDVYIEDVVERVRNRAREERDSLNNLVEEKELEYQNAENELADLRRQYRLSATQPSPGRGQSRNEDPIFEQLTAQQTSLDAALRDLKVQQALVDNLKERYKAEPDQRKKVVREAGVDVRNQLSEIDGRILDLKASQDGIRSVHSRWRKAQSEIESLEDLRRRVASQEVEDVVQVELEDNPERNRLYGQVQDGETEIVRLETRVDFLQGSLNSLTIRRDSNVEAQRRISELDNLVEQNREAFNRAYQRYQDQRTFVELISGPEGNPFDVTEDAEAPRNPTSPNPWVIRILALVLGIGLGLAISLLSEFGRSAFRTVNDIHRVMAAPVLGTVSRIVTKRETRRTGLQRTVVGLSSMILIGMILWITWAWKMQPDLLHPGIVEVIEGVRSSFR